MLEAVWETAAASQDIVVNESLAKIDYFLGIVELYAGDPDEGALGYWRKSLIISPNFTWDTALIADQDAQDIFEALRSEIRQRTQLPSGVPAEEIDGFRVYIDGNIVRSIDMVIEGRHLVQTLCPDGSLNSAWLEFGEPPDYKRICGLVSEVEESQPRRERGEGPSALQLGLWGGGGALLAGGAAMYFLAVEPAYQETQDLCADPTACSRAQADDATATFNRLRWIDVGLLGVGTAGLGVAFFVDDSLAIVPAGRGAALIGRF